MNNRFTLLIAAGLIFLSVSLQGQNRNWLPRVTPKGKPFVNTRIDNLGYWNTMISLGYAEANPYIIAEDPVPTGSTVTGDGIFVQDSPDIPTTSEPNLTQSENSVFVDPLDEDVVMNSNNSADWTGATVNQLYGADYLYSIDAAATWGGSFYGAGQTNYGDPAAAISSNGIWYVGKISSQGGQNVAYSTDHGQNWVDIVAGPPPGGPSSNLLDKNHLWIDNSGTSPYGGNLYDAWTCFKTGDPADKQVQLTRSTDQGLTWSTPVAISFGVNAGNFNHGVNIQTGPNGEVYAFWSIYDTWPADENAIGMAKSVNGGATFDPAVRIIGNIKGIRNSGTTKNMRVNSFPVAAVDISEGPYRGAIYVVWANIGVPGVNTGNDIDVYMIRSFDGGSTWSNPIRVNQDPPGLGKTHFFPWITCDPVTGNISIVFYDDRNTTSAQCETWVATSFDGGDTWSDFKVSDVAFTPAPIPGLAYGYFGDYLGITATNMRAYPVWTDNRSGYAMSYVSPIDLGPPPNQPYVIYHSNELALIPGKSRQNMNYGDSLYLSLGLKNIGDQPAAGLTATVRTQSPFILFTDSTESYGTMTPGEIKIVPEGFSFKVSDSVPDNLRIRFDVEASDPDTTWISHFTLVSHAPHLIVTSFTINDSGSGNNNHLLDPGETAEVTVTTSNTGDFDCYNATGTLTSLSESVVVNTGPASLDTIASGGSKTATFSVKVDDEAPVGTGVNLLFNALSGFYHASYNYQETIGVIMEDWETGNFQKFPWQFAGDKNWVMNNEAPYEGTWCAESGWIYDNQVSTLFLDFTTSVSDSITFFYKVSSEPDYDFLKFYIDNVLQDRWAGEQPWTRVAFPVSAGNHTFKWSYEKDIWAEAGQDRAWVDYIGFPPPPFPVMNAGPDDTICAGETYQPELADASQYDSLIWTSSGDGTFDTATILHPVYTPGPRDLDSGFVKLKLSGFAQYGLSYNSMLLSIGEYPQVNIAVDPKDTLCQWQSVTLSMETLESGSYLWMPGGFTTPVVTIDTSVTGGIGTTLFTAVAANQYGCRDTASVAITFKDCTALEEPANVFGVRLTPNPGDGRFVLHIHTPVPETVDLRIYSNNRTLLWSEAGIRIVTDLTKALDFREWSAGLYILEIERTSGIRSEKLIIRK